MKNICVVTSTRADYGIIKPLLRRLKDCPDIMLSIVVTGMHLCPEFGNTFQEIEADGFAIEKKIDIQLSSDLPSAMSKSMGMTLICFADYFVNHPPDLLVVLGDRYEIEAVCCAAVNQRIPIAHLHGGEVTEGAVDECYRHAISKMSSLHFTSCEPYRKRVIQLGEHPDTVFNVGAMGVENILSMPKLSLQELSDTLAFPLSNKEYAVVTFHPVTMEDNTGPAQLQQLMGALDQFPEMRFVITKANSDAGGREINRLWEEYGAKRDNCLVVSSLGAKRYLSALQYASMMIGNSSSGIMEGPASKIPTVNIGDRQKGRIMADSVINCTSDTSSIADAVKTAKTPAFQELAAKTVNPYGNGDTSRLIIKILCGKLDSGILPKRKFYNLDFEVSL